jgi:hypothetical protein
VHYHLDGHTMVDVSTHKLGKGQQTSEMSSCIVVGGIRIGRNQEGIYIYSQMMTLVEGCGFETESGRAA